MSLKEEILTTMKDKEKIHLKDIYEALNERSPHSIRATLNFSIKKGENVFERLGEGYYKSLNGLAKQEEESEDNNTAEIESKKKKSKKK